MSVPTLPLGLKRIPNVLGDVLCFTVRCRYKSSFMPRARVVQRGVFQDTREREMGQDLVRVDLAPVLLQYSCTLHASACPLAASIPKV